MSITKKQIIDSITIQATRSSPTDERRLDEDWIGYLVDKVAAELKVAQYLKTGILDPQWLLPFGQVTFHKVNIADDPNITFCDCEIGKAYIPQVISFISKDGNQDHGIYHALSVCGKYQYYPRRMSLWGYTPSDHISQKFKSYWRVNTAMYINEYVEKLRLFGFPITPEDAKLVQSEPIASGSIVAGTTYVVKWGQIVYNNIPRPANSTFTGVSGVTTFTGQGKVYLNSQAIAYRDTDPYPASAEMIRAIELEVLTKELQIEMKFPADVRNDSKDDAVKST